MVIDQFSEFRNLFIFLICRCNFGTKGAGILLLPHDIRVGNTALRSNADITAICAII
jgi:hypothetical protein